MTDNPHFIAANSWKHARSMLAFKPLEPPSRKGRKLECIRIHVRDHKLRELSTNDRTLEAHYCCFTLSQSRKGHEEARRLALDIAYGPAGRSAQIATREARVYELGPEPEPGDVDGRSPAVVTWHDAEMFYLLASVKLNSEALVRIAASLYQ